MKFSTPFIATIMAATANTFADADPASAKEASKSKSGASKSSKASGKSGKADGTCPCYTPDDLTVVTQDNVVGPYKVSCIQFNLPNEDGLHMDVLGIIGHPDEFGARITEDAEGVKHFQCAAPEFVDDEFISEKQYENCSQQIKDHCAEIGYPVPVGQSCPCFTKEDLLPMETCTKKKDGDVDTIILSDSSEDTFTLSLDDGIDITDPKASDFAHCSSPTQEDGITITVPTFLSCFQLVQEQELCDGGPVGRV